MPPPIKESGVSGYGHVRYETKKNEKGQYVGEQWWWYLYPEDQPPSLYERYSATGILQERMSWYDNKQLAAHLVCKRGKVTHYERYDWYGTCLTWLDADV